MMLEQQEMYLLNASSSNWSDITNYKQINKLITEEHIYKHSFPRHLNILAKTKEGLKSYKIISDAHTVHFHKGNSLKVLLKHKNGLLIGSGCAMEKCFDCITR